MGLSVVVSYGINAGKAAWLAILLGMCGGIILFFISSISNNTIYRIC
ncbi:hypothetical protein [Priestia megaterium]